MNDLSRHVLSSAALALLAGCGGSQPPIGAPGAMLQSRAIATHADRGGSWMLPEARRDSSKAWLYVDDTVGNAVYIYQLNKHGASQIGKITNGVDAPFASTVDDLGNLYVVNRVISGSVAVYAPGATSPSLVLTQDLTYPQGVAVDGSGDVWVTNRSNSGPGIAVFPPGQNTPMAYITGNLIRYPLEDVFDQEGNLYFADADTGVSEIPAGSQHPISLHLKGLRRNSAVGVALSASGILYVDNYDPSRGHVYTTRVYMIGSPIPKATLKGHVAGYNMAAGDVGAKGAVFIPDWYSGNVYVYKDGRNASFETLKTASEGTGGVAFKPAEVP